MESGIPIREKVPVVSNFMEVGEVDQFDLRELPRFGFGGFSGLNFGLELNRKRSRRF